MKTLHFLLILFCLTVSANPAAAQTPRGTIAGTVTYDDGTPVGNANIGLKLKGANDYNRIQTVYPDKDGKFTANVNAGIYVVITKTRCGVSRAENVEVPPNRTATVDVTMVSENCDEKEAKEELDWKACMPEWGASGQHISDSEKAGLVNTVLEELFRFEDHLMRDNYQEIIFSTANVDPAWINPFPGVRYSFLSPQQLQAKADSVKEGRFGYYAFSLETGSTCAYVGVSMQTAVSQKNPPAKDPNVFECPVGTSKGYLFRKEAGKWKKKLSRG